MILITTKEISSAEELFCAIIASFILNYLVIWSPLPPFIILKQIQDSLHISFRKGVQSRREMNDNPSKNVHNTQKHMLNNRYDQFSNPVAMIYLLHIHLFSICSMFDSLVFFQLSNYFIMTYI